MSRLRHRFWVFLTTAVMVSTGCHPTQPFYFFEDGDLSHYLDVATDIEYPDVDEPHLDEVVGTYPPVTLENADSMEMWDLSLEEVINIMLANSKVMRQLGGRVASDVPETLSRQLINTIGTSTVYDPALVESGYGAATGSPQSGTGVEAALAEFDAVLDSSMTWEKNSRPQNRILISTPAFDQDIGRFTTGITKQSASGGIFGIRNNTIYDWNNTPPGVRPLASDWTTNFEATFSQPLLQGRGTQYNRIAGPLTFQQYSGGFANPIDGVVISRIRTDLALADFEGGVRDLVEGAENAYWDLYFAFRDLEAKKVGRDSALATWQKIHALYVVGSIGGEAEKEAQARAQYHFFVAEVQTALTELLRRENRLRYTMGLAMADGRLIRPSDEPTTARVRFDWLAVHCEALARRVELRKKKWEVKKRQLELIASRNHLLPRLDAFGRYRWNGLGDDLIDTDRSGVPPSSSGSNAFEVLTGGNFQDWQIGLQLSVPIGFRQQMAQVRHHELLLAKARALLEDLELEISHQLGDAIRDVQLFYTTSQTNFNRRVAAEKEVNAVEAALQADKVTLDLLLDAQRRRSDAETAYYRSLVDYNRAIMNVHNRKGSLLEYNGVYLAEGPWPGKAYFDALREARKRDASTYLDYGFTRPNVFSRGAYQQQSLVSDQRIEYYEEPTEATQRDSGPEEVPTPAPEKGLQKESSVIKSASTQAARRAASAVAKIPAKQDRSHGTGRTGIRQVSTAASVASSSYESISSHSPASGVTTASGGTRPQHRFPGSGVRR